MLTPRSEYWDPVHYGQGQGHIRIGNLVLQHCRLVAQGGDLDIPIVCFGTEADQQTSALRTLHSSAVRGRPHWVW